MKKALKKWLSEIQNLAILAGTLHIGKLDNTMQEHLDHKETQISCIVIVGKLALQKKK